MTIKTHQKYINHYLSSHTISPLRHHPTSTLLTNILHSIELLTVRIHHRTPIINQRMARFALLAKGRSVIPYTIGVDSHGGIHAPSVLHEVARAATGASSGILVVGEAQSRHGRAYFGGLAVVPLQTFLTVPQLIQILAKRYDSLSLQTASIDR